MNKLCTTCFKQSFAVVLLAALSSLAGCAEKPRQVHVLADPAAQGLLKQLTPVFEQKEHAELKVTYVTAPKLLSTLNAANPPFDLVATGSPTTLTPLKPFLSLHTRTTVARSRLVLAALSATRCPGIPERLLSLPDKPKIALADPATIPAGDYAKQALTGLKLWQPLQSQLIKQPTTEAVIQQLVERQASYGLMFTAEFMPYKDSLKRCLTFDSHLHGVTAFQMAVTKNALQPGLASNIISYATAPEQVKELEQIGYYEAK